MNDNSQPPDLSDTEAFDRYRPYLHLLARRAMPKRMQARVSPSDLVQQTIAEAWRCRDQYRGEATNGQIGWLRGILTRVAAANIRQHMGVQGRDVNREIDVSDNIDQTNAGLEMIAASSIGPASAAIKNEQVLALSAAMETLPDDYRCVLIWRHFDDLSHAEMAHRLGKSEPAVRMLWIRALKSLRQAFTNESQSF